MAALGRALAVAGVAVLAACSTGSDRALLDARPTTTTPRPEPESRSANEIVEALSPSLVAVATPLGSGSGVLIEDGYVVTNAHVVDPFGTASVWPIGGYPEDLPVVGTDLFADIAVLGPLDQDAPPTELDSSVDIEVGGDVFLVGVPGDLGEEPDPTIARGIVSRQRQFGAYDLTYLQTDALIAGGQSGGAMVDDEGRVIGISSFDYEDFGFSLSVADVVDAVEAIVAGEATGYAPIPDGPLRSSATFRLPYRYDQRVLVFPAHPRPRTLELTLPTDQDVTLWMGDLTFRSTIVNAAYAEEQREVDRRTEGGLATEPVAPGTWAFELEADAVGLAYIGVRADEAVVQALSSEPFVELGELEAPTPVGPGDTSTGVINAFEIRNDYAIDLDAGERIEVSLVTPVDEVFLTVVAPGEWLAQGESFTGSWPDGVRATFTAETGGTHRLIVFAEDANESLVYEMGVSAG